MALLQTASNPYISIIGPIESAATRISMMGICNKGAGIVAGLIFGYIALKDADVFEKKLLLMNEADKNAALAELAGRVVMPYAILSAVLVVFAIAILFSGLPDIKDEGEDEKDTASAGPAKTSVFQFPHLILGVLAIFLYVGVEVMAGDTIISYGKSLGIELSEARYFTQWTLVSMLVGYVIGIITIPKYISQALALRICAIIGVAFTILAVLTSGKTSVLFIALIGLANSLMWPAIFPLGIDGLGKFTKIGSALLVTAIVGGAILPLLYGKLLQVWNPKDAYLMMVPCYLYILYFATKGYKAGKA
jgi:glucose/galactose transporter